MVHVLLLLVLNYGAFVLHLCFGKIPLATTKHGIFLLLLLSIRCSRLPLLEQRFLGFADLGTLSSLFVFSLFIHNVIGHYFLDHAYNLWFL